MDHNNVSSRDDSPVSTPKGIEVSKSKHQGTRFDNASASSAAHAHQHSSSESRKERDKDNTSRSPDTTEDRGASRGLGSSRVDNDVATKRNTVTTPSTTTTTPGPINPSAGEDPASLSEDRYPQSPTWPWGDSSDDLSNLGFSAYESTQQLFNMSFSQQGSAARRQPSDASETAQLVQQLVREYLVNVPPRSHTYDAIALVASLVNGGGGSGSPNELSESIARVCASINRELLIGDEDGRRTELAVIESIAAMAIEATYSGRQDHWHVLMRGLRDIIDRGGGMKAEWAETLNRVRKADIKGAVHAGSTPYFDLVKVFPSISQSLPPHKRAELAVRTDQLLSPCGIAQVNIESVQALAFFTQTVVLARHAPESQSVLLDRHAYAEDCLQVEYLLVKHPAPLRDEMGGSREADRLAQGLSPASDQSQGAAGLGGNPLNSLIRIAALLYIEDLLPDAHSLDLYTILLTALIYQTQMVLLHFRQRQSYPNTPSSEDKLPATTYLRPVLLWTCMVGHALTLFTNAERGTRLDPAIFEDCVGFTLAETPSAVEDESDDDLLLCEMLPLQELRSVTSDQASLLRQIVIGHETRQGWNRT